MNKLKIESFGEFSFPNSLNISPDGSKLLYAVSKQTLRIINTTQICISMTLKKNTPCATYKFKQ